MPPVLITYVLSLDENWATFQSRAGGYDNGSIVMPVSLWVDELGRPGVVTARLSSDNPFEG
jgi:hypothetical protein